MAWPTPNQVVNAAARELGLISSNVSNVFASTDKNVILLTDLLNALGQTLARQHPWSQLQRETTVTTVASTASYPLPADFTRVIGGTAWNRSEQLPAIVGSPQDWQSIQAQTATGIVQKVLRIYGGALHLLDTPAAAETFAYEYQSKYWVRDTIATWANSTAYTAGALVSNAGVVYTCTTGGTSAASPATGPSGGSTGITDGTCVWDYSYPSVDAAPPTAETSDTSTDYLMFDLRALVSGLKLEFRRAKGLDTTSEQQAFDMALAAALGGNDMAPVLPLGGRPRALLLGVANAPERGYGA